MMRRLHKIRVNSDNKRCVQCTKMAFNTSNKSISKFLTKMTMTIQKWLKEEKMRLERFKICCVNAQKEEAKSFPLKMPRSCWSGQYRTWDDSLDGLCMR
jgi:hypothetical protein